MSMCSIVRAIQSRSRAGSGCTTRYIICAILNLALTFDSVDGSQKVQRLFNNGTTVLQSNMKYQRYLVNQGRTWQALIGFVHGAVPQARTR